MNNSIVKTINIIANKRVLEFKNAINYYYNENSEIDIFRNNDFIDVLKMYELIRLLEYYYRIEELNKLIELSNKKIIKINNKNIEILRINYLNNSFYYKMIEYSYNCFDIDTVKARIIDILKKEKNTALRKLKNKEKC